MPLESLSQPFNPDEPGRKIREVQVEHEPAHEKTAREHFEDLKKLPIYDEFGKWRQGIEDGNLLHDSRDIQNLASVCELALGNTLPDQDKNDIEASLSVLWEFPIDEFCYALIAECWCDTGKAQEIYSATLNLNPKLVERNTLNSNLILYAGVLLRDPVAIQALKNRDADHIKNADRVLFQILFDTEIDPDKAYREWNDVKSQYYDADAQLWHYSKGIIEGSCDTTLQLIPIVVQARLEAKRVLMSSPDKQPKIPEERNF